MLQFTTRIPVPVNLEVGSSDYSRGMKLFPLIGFVVGVILWGVYKLLLPLDPLVAAVGAVLAEAAVTGGLHLDGLADTFDGLYSNRRGEEMLRIMKDSRLGTHGVLAVTGVLLLKVTLLNALSSANILLAMGVFSRLAMVFGAAFSISARREGLGFLFIEGVSWKDALLAGLLSVVLIFNFMGIVYIVIAAGILLGVSLVLAGIMKRRIGGMTGDTLGALGEISSVLFLFLSLLFKPLHLY